MADKRILMKPWVFYPLVIVSILIVIIVIWVCWFYPVTTVLLLRHAEKSATPSNDPPLSEAGQARAQTLVHVAGEAGMTAIYTTEFLRTQQTVQPLATHLSLTINQVNVNDVEGLVYQVLSDQRGEIVMICGHSNTIPQIIEGLGGDLIPSIDENEYDNLFIVTIYGFGRATVVRLNYGSPD